MVALVGVGVVMPGVAQAGPSRQAPALACRLTPTNGTISGSMWVGLDYRTYKLRVPAGLTGSQVPLLLSLHGAGGNGGVQETLVGVAEERARQQGHHVRPPARGHPLVDLLHRPQ